MPVATQRGGAEATLLQLLRHARDDAWLVAFLEEGPLVETASSLDVDAIAVPAGRVRDLRDGARVMRQLAARLGSWRPDVILSWMSKAHLYAGPIAARMNVP